MLVKLLGVSKVDREMPAGCLQAVAIN